MQGHGGRIHYQDRSEVCVVMEYNDEIAIVQTLSAKAGLSAYLKFIVQFLIVHI